MLGFGTPIVTVGAPYDWGFGAPSPASWDDDALELGFGEPLDFDFVPRVVSGLPLPDHGGEIVVLAGTWPDLGAPPGEPAGPFRVRIRNQDTDVVYPDPARFLGCLSTVATIRGGAKGTACQTDKARENLSFVLPPAPPGLYTIEVAWGPFWAEGVALEDVLRIVYRGRSPQEYALRLGLPPLFHGAGPRIMRDERLLVAANETGIRRDIPFGGLRALFGAFAEELQVLSGSPVTMLREELALGDAAALVETTLGFPTAGRLFIGGRRYEYTGKGDTLFSGLTCIDETGLPIPAKADVILDRSSIFPE